MVLPTSPPTAESSSSRSTLGLSARRSTPSRMFASLTSCPRPCRLSGSPRCLHRGRAPRPEERSSVPTEARLADGARSERAGSLSRCRSRTRVPTQPSPTSRRSRVRIPLPELLGPQRLRGPRPSPAHRLRNRASRKRSMLTSPTASMLPAPVMTRATAPSLRSMAACCSPSTSRTKETSTSRTIELSMSSHTLLTQPSQPPHHTL